jgi:hypothetical protein
MDRLDFVHLVVGHGEATSTRGFSDPWDDESWEHSRNTLLALKEVIRKVKRNEKGNKDVLVNLLHAGNIHSQSPRTPVH